MPDDVDHAQECEAEFLTHQLAEHNRARSKDLKNLPLCERARDGDCDQKVFVTTKGTRARFCTAHWAEFREEQAAG